jgi:hypothetical protein
MKAAVSNNQWADSFVYRGTRRGFERQKAAHVAARLNSHRRAADDGRTEMTEALADASVLTAADRCDRCGAAAKVLAVLATGGELLFCGHHANEHTARLEQLAAVIHDARVA